LQHLESFSIIISINNIVNIAELNIDLLKPALHRQGWQVWLLAFGFFGFFDKSQAGDLAFSAFSISDGRSPWVAVASRARSRNLTTKCPTTSSCRC
jgi:hypothetical protein